ncbi:hypothetical protein BOTBODRAFT_31237 [Botryobasidium botryosum FD-172 SS1]|uniref:Aldehyde dehydrogenase domain-containing protein n=1 Tax=Botryobasidium botryosum (strain FD-172 SS1) TaxID=930990 RepID=A0A067MX78_BOTB1|nr:hypothetical protein BOTBODRAFT_31237 [Botryobasidium botryosum FD-172 SS1]
MPPTFDFDFKFQQGFQGRYTFPTGLFINGEFVDSVDKETIDVVNPATGAVIATVSAGNEKDVDIAVQAATKAYKSSWGLKVSGLERGKLLFKLADLIERDVEEISCIEVLNVGKPYLATRHRETIGASNYIRYFAGLAGKLHGKTVEIDESIMAYTRYEPLGVVGAIIPWNFPLFLLVWKLAPALAAGNAIIIKPSEITPLTTLRLCKLFNEAGFPPGVVNVITGTGQAAGAAITKHMGIAKVSFTGSTAAGRHVMSSASSSNLKSVSLELGGKSPSLVFDDADLEQAVRWTAAGIFTNAGQMCYGGSRIYVQEGIYDKFLESFLAFVQKSKVGDPWDSSTTYGPQVSQAQMDRVLDYIDIGKKEGAVLARGGFRVGDLGYYIEPTVFTEVKQDMRIMKEEIFGPVVALAKFKNEEDVLEMANGTMYGLAAAVFTKDVTRAIKMSNELEAGTVWVNMTLRLQPSMPFGGYKESGIGHDLGEEALRSYYNLKSVHINLGGRL